jgi:hypothetical protein
LPASSYPYWLSALIGAQETADGYSKLVEDTKTFFYVFPDSVPIYSAATKMADGFTGFNDTQKQNAKASDDTYENSATQTNFIWNGTGMDTVDASKLKQDSRYT